MYQHDDLPTHYTLLRLLSDLDNEAAWEIFVQRYRPMIDRWCCSRLGPHDAEDVTARTLVKLVRQMAGGAYDRTRGRFRPWLRSVVENELRDFRRSRQRRPDVGLGAHDLAYWPDPASLDDLAGELEDHLHDDMLLADEIVSEVRNIVTPGSWAAFWHTRCLGQSSSEAARHLGMSVTAVSQARYRVGKALQRLWHKRQRAALPA